MEKLTNAGEEWLRLGSLGRVPPGEGRRFLIEGSAVAVFHTRAGLVYAVDALCPHQGGPLDDGLLGSAALTCPLHGFKFDLTTGRALGHDCGNLKTYAVQVNEAGEILLARPASAGVNR